MPIQLRHRLLFCDHGSSSLRRRYCPEQANIDIRLCSLHDEDEGEEKVAQAAVPAGEMSPHSSVQNWPAVAPPIEKLHKNFMSGAHRRPSGLSRARVGCPVGPPMRRGVGWAARL